MAEKKQTKEKKKVSLKKETEERVPLEKETEEKKETKKEVCEDRDCPIHGKLKARGRIFEGIVTRKFPKRIAIEFERSVYIRKYERFLKNKTRIHARLPKCMEDDINIGDLIQVQECRPLSKIIHHVVIKKIKGGGK